MCKTISYKDNPYKELPGELVKYKGEKYRVDHVSGMEVFLTHKKKNEQISVGYTEFME